MIPTTTLNTAPKSIKIIFKILRNMLFFYLFLNNDG